MKPLFHFSVLCLLTLFACQQQEASVSVPIATSPPIQFLPITPSVPLTSLQEKAKKALAYCKKNGLDTSLCLLLDMSAHSGIERFFVWDFAKNTVLLKGLVSHGCCSEPWGEDSTKDNATFSNINGSHCSSLGKYRVGNRGPSQWGILVNYKLHGLEESNANAYKRTIVLHSWEAIGDEPTFPLGVPEGWGCPAISNKK